MKYIDAEKLKANIKGLQCEQGFDTGEAESAYQFAIKDILAFIDTLQQEQPEVQNGKFVFPKYLYARTKNNKTIDMSYAPQDMTAVEYIRNDFVQQEQPEVDLDKKTIIDYVHNHYHYDKDFDGYGHSNFRPVFTREDLTELARHFYNLGLNAKK